MYQIETVELIMTIHATDRQIYNTAKQIIFTKQIKIKFQNPAGSENSISVEIRAKWETSKKQTFMRDKQDLVKNNTGDHPVL